MHSANPARRSWPTFCWAGLARAVSVQVISQVRFSDLEVPTDAQVLLATLRLERKQRTQPVHLPSTYAQDLASIAGVWVVREGWAAGLSCVRQRRRGWR